MLKNALNHPQRLASLRGLDLLDSPAEAAFDRLTRLASKLVHAPISLVSLVEQDRQFFKSFVGLDEPWASARQSPLSHSFCQHVVASNEPLVIEDTRQHPLVHDNLAIRGLNAISYLGIPLTLSDGSQLGSFCVIDHQPRRWTEEEIALMRDLAETVMTEIELRHELKIRQQTEARHLQFALEKERARILANFIQDAGHEFKTPLTIIKSSIYMLTKISDEEKRAYQLSKMDTQTDNLIHLVDSLMMLASVQEQDRAEAEEPCQLNDLVRIVVEEKRVEAEQKHQQLTLTMQGELPRLRCIPLQLAIAFNHLLENAIRFTPGNGAVYVTTFHEEEGLCIEIEDNGVGISQEALPHIFERFFREDTAHTTRGLGLGLAIAQEIIHAHEGTIEVISEVGRGSLFRVRLPIHK